LRLQRDREPAHQALEGFTHTDAPRLMLRDW
jgi:hypothetical protein